MHDLCESQLVVASGTGPLTIYRIASDDEMLAPRSGQDSEGLGELLVAIIYREGPLTLEGIVDRVRLAQDKLDALLCRLVDEGRIERVERDGTVCFRVARLVIPLGAIAGWEAAVFDHFKAMVSTVICRLRGQPLPSQLTDVVGGSTYTLELWPGHPMQDEVFGTLQRFREELSVLRQRAAELNQVHPVPDAHTRVVIYVGQCLIEEGSDDNEEPTERTE